MIFYKRIVVVTFMFVYIFVSPKFADAEVASLYISPNTGVYPIGEPFVAEIRIDTGGQKIGTIDASIAYDSEDVEYVSVSDDGSVMSRVSVDSNRTKGRIDISGFITHGEPAYDGNNGLVATVTFIPLRNVATELRFAQAAATAPLSLTASVAGLANVLSELRTATYTLIPKNSIPATVAYASENTDFEITPLPIPNNEWFGTTSVKLSWSLPEGVTEMRTLVTSNPEDEPTKVYQVPVSSVMLKDVKEGDNYFLLQFKRDGVWGLITSYSLKVDLSSPDYIVVKEAERKDSSDPRVEFVVESTDLFSGIEYYEMSIDGDESEKWEDDKSGIYKPEGVTPGEHILTAVAYDMVGNSTSTDVLFIVKSLESPSLINENIPERVLAGDIITIKGNSYPNADVTVYISHDDSEAYEKVAKSGDDGVFVANITENAKSGRYTIWLTVTDERGGISPNSIKRSVDVTQPSIVLYGDIAVTYLSVIVPLIALIMLLGLVLWLGYSWMKGYRKRVKYETNEAHDVARKEFKKLRVELIKQIGMLEKANLSRELTREEMRIFRDISNRLENMEKRIVQEIDDIEVVTEEIQHEAPRNVDGALEKYRNALNAGERIEAVAKDDGVVHLKTRRM